MTRSGSTPEAPRAEIRAAVLGLSREGGGVDVGPDARVVLGADPDRTARERFAAEFQGAVVVADAAHSDVASDLVWIRTPTGSHLASARTALRLGARVVLCEPPLAPTLEEGRELAELCEAAGATLIVNHFLRWSRLFRRLRDGGEIGRPCLATVRYTGGLLHEGSHFLDLLLGLVGPRPAAWSRNGALHLAWPGGPQAWLVPVCGVEHSLAEGEVHGTRGCIRFREGAVTLSRAGEGEEPLARDGMGDPVGGAVAEAVRLAREGGKPTCGAEEGLAVLRLLEQAAR